MPSTGYPSYTNSTITLTTGGSYSGDGTNGYVGGTPYSFTVRRREITQKRAREDTTDTGLIDATNGPIGIHFAVEGYFKTGTIPPNSVLGAYVLVAATVGFTVAAVILVETFRATGVIGTALNYLLEGDSVGTGTFG
jgi:hypothetical protein